ncbi:hypothetical protein [Arthrobacter sp. H35-D1]|uniref:hypothetical protein n=1 Tax=Arthrobacter sp. H35-D1 TaxID=3046202 RepID=UPI0024B9D8CA|nr:hypothetical protein [Arthrobacter sp. H35-D1]MDJ0315422.1 hypothetical protein [Arthrobacter sp. H35-D1]
MKVSDDLAAAGRKGLPQPKNIKNIKNTVILTRKNLDFPHSRRESFMDSAALKPNTAYVVQGRLQMDPVTGNPVPSVQKYFTDGAGKVTRVDTFGGVKTAWPPELNNLKPGVRYNVDVALPGGGRNHFSILTDGSAKPVSVTAEVHGLFQGNINRKFYRQIMAGIKVGGPGCEGGRLIRSLFGGPGESGNLLAQHIFQNRGAGAPNAQGQAFYQLENQLAAQVRQRLETGQADNLKLGLDAVPGTRVGLPSKFEIGFAFDGAELVKKSFSNLPSEIGVIS